jgi:hypothetical protein
MHLHAVAGTFAIILIIAIAIAMTFDRDF